MFIDGRITDFLEAVSAKRPTPGGGSVSALVGALGAALGVMTARYSESVEAEGALEEVRAGFLPLVDADAEAYGLVASAMSLPKDSDETKRRRKAALQTALGEAAEVPLKGMRLALRGLDALAELAPSCNKHLLSDLSGAAGFLGAALEGCGENVKVNAAALVDRARAAGLEEERERLTAEGARRKERIRRAAESAAAGK
jgi:formiminotetrahydrofolate cyclodeaminase